MNRQGVRDLNVPRVTCRNMVNDRLPTSHVHIYGTHYLSNSRTPLCFAKRVQKKTKDTFFINE